jgi:hypothetical protein
MEEDDEYHASFYDGILGDLPKEMERRRPTSAAQLHAGKSSVSVSSVEDYDDGLGRLRELHSIHRLWKMTIASKTRAHKPQ